VDPSKVAEDQKIYSAMVEKVITTNFIMKDGKKVEVFMNEKGQFYRKDANGKTILLNDTELAAI
jgi:hypothetical protein